MDKRVMSLHDDSYMSLNDDWDRVDDDHHEENQEAETEENESLMSTADKKGTHKRRHSKCWKNFTIVGDKDAQNKAKRLFSLCSYCRGQDMQDQLVCHGCRNLLMYPRVAASSVRCALCNTINMVPSHPHPHPHHPHLSHAGMDMAHIVCGGCRTMLMYTPGANSVRCSCCQTTNLVPAPSNQVAQINCGHCRTTLMYPYGASSVKCAICQFVTNVNMGNGRVPLPTNRPNGTACPGTMPSTSTSTPPSQTQTVVVENPMSVDESGKLASARIQGKNQVVADFQNSSSMKDVSLASARIQGKNQVVADFQNSSSMNEERQRGPIVVDENSSYPIILKAAKERTVETECILVFSCNDELDVDETSFIESISKELHKREVTPLTCNPSGGENLDAELLNRSRVGIMVLSNSYACSRQSLDHLVAIMEHWKAKNLVIIPIYFKVTLSDISGSEGRFEALHYLSSAEEDRVQKWKAAMAYIASIDGHEWTKESQVVLAEKVARKACLRLYIKNSKNMVRMLALLNQSQPSDADIVGIWGMAGIGKTSIAREIFGILAPQYDMCYFLQDFYLMCQEKGLRQMRDDFFSKVFGEEKPSISACDIKPSFMRDWFHNKTICVVLDDVTNARDAEAVVGGFGWFSHGHRIILTSRRKQVLVQCKVKEPYEIQRLSETESFRLCKQYLNGESVVISELMSCSSGIPLVLKVLGSSVSVQPINNKKEHLQKLRRNPPTQIQEAFRRSFDGLDENEKNIFLDLACFFQGESKDHVVQLLDACGFLTYLGICDLIDESLISLVDNKIEIPIPFQDMGRFIVHEEDEDPCKRSRLWDSNDITDVLTNNSGTEVIEGVFLDASDLTCELSPTVFSKMYRLRLLKLYCSPSGNQCKLKLSQGLDTLPDELRLLHWENYPLKCLPQNFKPENLVEVNMPYSNMEKLWEGKKNLEKLKKINLSHSRNLTDILMLSDALNLEHIDLEGCTSLVDVSTSIRHCWKLVSLNMKDCSHLRSLLAMVDFTSLKLLNMSGCSEIEKIQDFAPNLKELYLAGTAIKELPLSIQNLTELVTLDLENCKRLQKLPSGLSNSRSIVELKLSGCTSLGLGSMETSMNSPLLLGKRKR